MHLKSALHDLSLDGIRLASANRARASGHRAAHRLHAHLARDADRGLVALAFDKAGVPFDYISTQTVAKQDDLRSKYDVIVFAPVGRVSALDILNGMPMWNNAMPWQKTDLTPNLAHRLDRRHPPRSGLRRAGASQEIRRAGRPANHLRRYGAVRHRHRVSRPASTLRRPAKLSRGWLGTQYGVCGARQSGRQWI